MLASTSSTEIGMLANLINYRQYIRMLSATRNRITHSDLNSKKIVNELTMRHVEVGSSRAGAVDMKDLKSFCHSALPSSGCKVFLLMVVRGLLQLQASYHHPVALQAGGC